MFEIPWVPRRSVSVTAGLTSVHDVVLVGGSTHIKFSTQESASQELVVLYLTHTEDILPMS